MNSSNRQITGMTDIAGIYGLRNYILNPGAEINTSGWATYADAAGNIPVNGTGGSPNITWTRTTTTPLKNDASFLLTKDAANRQGEGVSYDFTIDTASQGKVLTMEFDYVINSGTFVGSQNISTYSDVIVYMYDVTNSQLIEPVSILLDGGPTGVYYHYKGTFQTNTNSTSYRFILHIATTSASAYTLKMDNFNIYPQYANSGTVVTDWQSFTPTFSGFGTTSNVSINYRRIGDSIEIMGSFQCGTTAASAGSFTIPSGLSIDTSKAYRAVAVNGVGHWTSTNSTTQAISSSDREGLLFFDGSATGTIYFAGSNGTTSNLFNKENGSNVTNTNGVITVQCKFPILGWSSSVVLSNETDVRVVAARYKSSAGQSVSSTPAILNFSTKDYDTHGAYSSGTYTCPFSGYYKVSGAVITVNVSISSANTNNMKLYKNGAYIADMGVVTAQATVNTTHALGGETTIFCNAGDTLAVYVDYATSTSLGTNDKQNWVSFERISGPSAIATGTIIAARYYDLGTGAVSSTLAGSTTAYATKEYDTTGSYNTSNNTYTAPVSGYYRITATDVISGTFVAGDTVSISVFKNGSAHSQHNNRITAASTNNEYNITTDTVYLLAGDTITIRHSSSGTSPVFVTNNNGNYFTIEKIN